jgi:hypothetical protein
MCMFCRSLIVLLYFLFWPLCCLFFFNLRIPIAPLVFSNSSCIKTTSTTASYYIIDCIVFVLAPHWIFHYRVEHLSPEKCHQNPLCICFRRWIYNVLELLNRIMLFNIVFNILKYWTETYKLKKNIYRPVEIYDCYLFL